MDVQPHLLPAALGDAAAVVDAIPSAVVIVDADGRIALVNAATVELTGFDANDLVGRPVEVLVPPSRAATHRGRRTEFQRNPVRRPMGTGVDIACVRADGTEFPADISLAPLELGGRVYVIATVRDETERRETEAVLAFQALHDPLTALANRSLLFDRLDHALARASRTGCPVAVYCVDLDGFKEVNDARTHAVGDIVLGAIARRLERVVRPGDTVARIGGDEFVVLCEDLVDDRTTLDLGERLVSAVSGPIAVDDAVIELTGSVGIVRTGGLSSVEAIDAADRAMYRAKRAGGGRVAT